MLTPQHLNCCEPAYWPPHDTIKLSNSIYMLKTMRDPMSLIYSAYYMLHLLQYIQENVPKCQPLSLYVLDHHKQAHTAKKQQSKATLFFNVSVAHLESHVNSSHGYQQVLCLIIPSPLSEDERELYNHREIEQLFWRMR